jgi:hypothetical protein
LQKALVGALRNSGSSQNQVRIDLWQPFSDGPHRAAM